MTSAAGCGGEGLSVCVDGKTVATRSTLGKLSVQFEKIY